MLVTFLRSAWNNSMQFAVIDSNTEIQDVNAANAVSMKNINPMSLPASPME